MQLVQFWGYRNFFFLPLNAIERIKINDLIFQCKTKNNNNLNLKKVEGKKYKSDNEVNEKN